MYRVSADWVNRILNKQYPTPYVLIETSMGWRVFGARHLGEMDLVYGMPYADGTYYADGSVYAGYGYLTLLSFDARVMSFGSITRTMRPKSDDLLVGYTAKEKSTVSVDLDNKDYFFNDIIQTEPILGKRLQIKIGYAEDIVTDHIFLFDGLITSFSVERDGIFSVEALEELDDLSGHHFLNRAGRFSNPRNTNDRLPIVYGDCSDGTSGNWIAPCIDTVNDVYCFAGHAVQSVADGNSIHVYINDLEIDPAEYTFSESNASYDNMATVTLLTASGTDVGTSDIVVAGKGKDTGSSGTLMENIIDIMEDLLSVEVGWSGTLEPTAKAMSRSLFEGKSYIAGGVITDDFDIWEELKRMAQSFLGNLYLNGENELVVVLDIRKWNDAAYYETQSVMSVHKAEVKQAKQTLDGIVNHIPGSYAYDYYRAQFRSHTDSSSLQDTISQQTYGDRNPGYYRFYYCRDLASVQSMQDILVDKLKSPIWQIQVRDISAENLFLELGDIIQFSAQNIYEPDGAEMINQYFAIVGITLDVDSYNMQFDLIDTGNFKTEAYLADGTYYADGSIYAGNSRDTTLY